jgi:hypothetical protein
MSEPSEPREQAQGNAATRLAEILRERDAQKKELATLAARICPELCQKNPSRAIEIAQALLKEASRNIAKAGGGTALIRALMEMAMESTEVQMKEMGLVIDEGLRKAILKETWSEGIIDGFPRKVAEYLDTLLEKYRSFEPGVKLITGEWRFDRAMPWFRKFIRSRTPNEQACKTEIDKARKDGFTGARLCTFKWDFDGWKVKEKSRIARTKSAKRKKKDQL